MANGNGDGWGNWILGIVAVLAASGVITVASALSSNATQNDLTVLDKNHKAYITMIQNKNSSQDADIRELDVHYEHVSDQLSQIRRLLEKIDDKVK